MLRPAPLRDSWSRIGDRSTVEHWSKPLATIGVIGLALVSGASHTTVGWAVAALTLCLVGDVALLPKIDRFVLGLGAFLLGHLAFIVVFCLQGLHQARLAGIALVPQGSMNSLNPVMRIRAQIADALADHGEAPRGEGFDTRVRELMRGVGLPPETADRFPHELSGGMKQRACIAIAISMRPRVVRSSYSS